MILETTILFDDKKDNQIEETEVSKYTGYSNFSLEESENEQKPK